MEYSLNNLGKKLNELESKVVQDEPRGETFLSIHDDAEQTLHNKAAEIRQKYFPQVMEIFQNSSYTYDEMLSKLQAINKMIPEDETAILTQSHNLYIRRLQDLLYEHFKHLFPKDHDTTVRLRIMWFFKEMVRLSIVCHVQDSEWNHNRNEDDPHFDDFRWWEIVDSKIKQDFPKGVFTPETYETLEDIFNEKIAESLAEFYAEHPEKKPDCLKDSDELTLTKALCLDKKAEWTQ